MVIYQYNERIKSLDGTQPSIDNNDPKPYPKIWWARRDSNPQPSGYESIFWGTQTFIAVHNPLFLLHTRICASTEIHPEIRRFIPNLLPKKGIGSLLRLSA